MGGHPRGRFLEKLMDFSKCFSSVFFFFNASFSVMSALTLILKAAPRRDSLPYVGLRILVGVQNKSAVKAPVQALPETAPFRMSERDLAFIQTFRKKNSEEKEERWRAHCDILS